MLFSSDKSPPAPLALPILSSVQINRTRVRINVRHRHKNMTAEEMFKSQIHLHARYVPMHKCACVKPDMLHINHACPLHSDVILLRVINNKNISLVKKFTLSYPFKNKYNPKHSYCQLLMDLKQHNYLKIHNKQEPT